MFGSQSAGRGHNQNDRIKQLIEKSFNSPDEEARILNLVRQLDKKSKTILDEKHTNASTNKTSDSIDEPYVFGGSSTSNSKENDHMQLFDGQLNVNATYPNTVPNSQSSNSSSSNNQQKVVQGFPQSSSNSANNVRPSSSKSLDALLGTAGASSQNSNWSVTSSSSRGPPPANKPFTTTSGATAAAPKQSSSGRPPVSKPVNATGSIVTAFSKRSVPLIPQHIILTYEDFMGMDSVCTNVGATTQSLQNLIKLSTTSTSSASDSGAVMVMCGVYVDGNTSLHSGTNKYCTPSVQCHNWMCCCDRHIRAVDATDKLIGVAMMTFDSSAVLSSASSSAEIVHFLPLIKCNDEPSTAAADAYGGGIEFPLPVETTQTQRWNALLTILSAVSLRKIIFNAQLFLFPVMAYLHRQQQQQQALSTSCITEACANLWDPKIATYLCDTDIPEESLELYSLLVRYKINTKQTLGGVSSSSSGSSGGVLANEGKFTSIFYKIRDEMRSIHSLMKVQERELQVREGLHRMFTTIEMPVVALLSSMESIGIPCNVDYLNTMHQRLSDVILSLEDSARLLIKEHHHNTSPTAVSMNVNNFNLASPEQVANVLYGHFNLTPAVGVAAGHKHASTSEESLQKIKHLHPIVEVILQFRAANKLLTTYCSTNLTQFVHTSVVTAATTAAVGCRSIHANWNQTIVRTGRLSCSKPNLQNIPNRQQVGDVNVNIREAIEAPEGCLLVSADYSQIEMRVLAHLCQDPVMIALFNRDKDIYRQLASKIMNKLPEHITTEERNKAKVVCLGVLYGMGAPATAAKLGINVAHANQITSSFFNHFKQMKSWIQNIKSQAKQHGYIRTLLGRRRYLPDIQSSERATAALGERQAVNSVIQGTASDLIKYAMINVDKALQAFAVNDNNNNNNKRSPQLIMQIHDELIFSFPVSFTSEGFLSDESSAALDEFVQVLHRRMNDDVVSALNLRIPLLVNVKQGMNWGHMNDYVVQTTTTAAEEEEQDEDEVLMMMTEGQAGGEGTEDLDAYFEDYYAMNNDTNQSVDDDDEHEDDVNIVEDYYGDHVVEGETVMTTTNLHEESVNVDVIADSHVVDGVVTDSVPVSVVVTETRSEYDIETLYDEGW